MGRVKSGRHAMLFQEFLAVTAPLSFNRLDGKRFWIGRAGKPAGSAPMHSYF